MRQRTPRRRCTQARLRWLDSSLSQEPEVEPGGESEMDSISSEENVAEEGVKSPAMGVMDENNRPHQDIWDPSEVLQSLRALPGGEELEASMEIGNRDLVLQHQHGHTTGLLLAAWRGDSVLLSSLLTSGASPFAADNGGRTPLHLASCGGAEDCVDVLLHHGASAMAWDVLCHATPLHCAASAGHVGCVKRLLLAGADVNAGLAGGRSALHYAVQSNSLDCVQELLRSGACPNTPQVFTETPLHVAAAMGFAASVKVLLEYGADVRVQFGPGKITALHLAAEDGNAECARLLLDAGAHINALNSRLQTPLHIAALAQSVETLELLLQRGADVNAEDTDGRTPLHSAIVKVCHSCECVRLLLDAGAAVNKADSFGYMPLHIAALNEFSNCVFLLLRYGADVAARTNGGVSALSFIVRRTPDILPRFEAQLDAAVKLHEHEIGDVDCELQLDFRILVPNVESGESGLLLAFIEVGQRQILNHPLCQTFLFLKWKRIRKFFLFSLMFHAIFVLVYSAYVVGIFLRDCSPVCSISLPVQISGYILLILTFILLAKELFQMAHSCNGYIRHWENWLQLQIIICACVTSIPTIILQYHVYDWQHHVAAIGIFLTWVELMMLVGRFPMFGLYVQMFTTVAVNFAKFLLAYCCLLVAFSLSFGVLFPNYKAFKNVMWNLIKVVVMMSGELEFEDIFYGNENDQDKQVMYPGTAHLMFLAFVLLVTVILTNLLVGLAVSDIQGLQQSAGLDRLVRQAELVAHLESMLFSRLLRCLPTRLLALCHRSALLLTSPYHWVLHIRPNDPREHRAPRDLIDAAYRLVAGRRERIRRSAQVRRSNAADSDYFYFNCPRTKRAARMEEDYIQLSSMKAKRIGAMEDDYITITHNQGKHSIGYEDDYSSVYYMQNKHTTKIEDDYIPLKYSRIKRNTAIGDEYPCVSFRQSTGKHSTTLEDDYSPVGIRMSRRTTTLTDDDFMPHDLIKDKRTTKLDEYIPLSYTSFRKPYVNNDERVSHSYRQTRLPNTPEENNLPLTVGNQKTSSVHVGSLNMGIERTLQQILSQLNDIAMDVKNIDAETKKNITELNDKTSNLTSK
ncbi:transient receptor potential channel pyrexia-like [Anabrus simplex]|uniref:transient receptor potential channel pyrexia-like n=1 Tax=Anabrus simplex TaxID=316456 RepID=UPI0035A2B02E